MGKAKILFLYLNTFGLFNLVGEKVPKPFSVTSPRKDPKEPKKGKTPYPGGIFYTTEVPLGF